MNDRCQSTDPDPHRGPFAFMGNDELLAAFERVAVDPDSPTAPMLLAEMQHRGLVE